MLRRRFAYVLVVLISLLPSSLAAQPVEGAGQITTLARTAITDGAKSVAFEGLEREGRVTAMRLAIDRGQCIVDRVTIFYSNGQIHTEAREIKLDDEGRRSAPIDPRVEGRLVERVEVHLKAGACEAGLQMRVLGAQTDDMRKAVERRKAYAPKKRSIVRVPVESGDTPKSAAPEEKPKYSEVDLFYGTSREDGPERQPQGVKMASFGPAPHPKDELTVGRATVTVPLEGRNVGQLNRPEYRVLSLSYEEEDINRHFTLFRVENLDQAGFIAAAKAARKTSGNLKDHALVFVHGYNVSFDDALFRGAQLSFDMKFDGLTFVFGWPSYSGYLGYSLDRERAIAARIPLRRFIDLVQTIMDGGTKRIHFIAHSMGTQTLMDALSDYQKPTGATDPIFGQVVFAASDVLRESFRGAVTRISQVASGITLYASSKDWALTIARGPRLGEAPAGLVKSGSVPYVAPGLDSIDVSALETAYFARNHSTFSERQPLVEDMLKLFADNTRPPSLRNRSFLEQKLPRNAGVYWRYTAP